mgnify:CR=1 FL=1
MSQTIRAFYAHPSGEDAKSIARVSISIRKLVRARGELAGKDLKVSVISGRDDFRINCRGDWGIWAKSVVKRQHAITRKPYYDFFVVPGECVGRATAQIVDYAIKSGRPVFLIKDKGEEGAKLERITQVYPYDVEDWQGGFRCEVPEEKKPEKEKAGPPLQPELPLTYKENSNAPTPTD